MLLVSKPPMIRALMQKLGLNRIGDLVADEAKRVQVEVLREEREVLARMIARLDERIAGLGGKRRGRPPKAASPVAPAAGRRPRRRRRRVVHAPGETLRDMVEKALVKAGGLVKATTLVKLVKKLGYRTTAKPSTLLTSIYHVLADTKVFRRMGKGVYGLKKEPAGRMRAGSKARERTSKRRGTSASSATMSEELQILVLRAFRQGQEPMSARRVARRVRSRVPRAKWSSKDLLASVEQVLADKKLFRRVGKERYELALPSTSKRGVGRPRKSAESRGMKPEPTAVEEQKSETVAMPATQASEVKHG